MTACDEKLGFAYVYGQDGTLLGEYGMGGSNSTGTTQYIYLPTANGPMPIAAIVNGVAYAVHSDHLNTPRKLTQPDGQVAWQWAYSAFGDEQPTLGAKRFTSETTNPTTGTTTIPEVTFNLRYPGQYYDKESNLHYNYFRSYSAERGRYTQADPIGLEGGFNRFGYVDGNPLDDIDPSGLQSYMRPRRPGWPDWSQPSQPNPSCATAECAAGLQPVPKRAEDFNKTKCVQEYLKNYYGKFGSNVVVPNFSLQSYIPGSGMALDAWRGTGVSLGTKGLIVGVPEAISIGVEASAVAGAGVAGGGTSPAMLALGSRAGQFAWGATWTLGAVGGFGMGFATAANTLALIHCGCQ